MPVIIFFAFLAGLLIWMKVLEVILKRLKNSNRFYQEETFDDEGDIYDEDEENSSRSRPKNYKAKRYSGRCDGDCANCPPHYGYRHGRWYYGHDHVEGCEFGGNKGGGR